VQLVDCHLEWRNEELSAFASHKSKAIERFECISNLEIKCDSKIFREPRLDTDGEFGSRWGRFRFTDEMIREHRFFSLLILGGGD
jgi:hypothetical protein